MARTGTGISNRLQKNAADPALLREIRIRRLGAAVPMIRRRRSSPMPRRLWTRGRASRNGCSGAAIQAVEKAAHEPPTQICRNEIEIDAGTREHAIGRIEAETPAPDLRSSQEGGVFRGSYRRERILSSSQKTGSSRTLRFRSARFAGKLPSGARAAGSAPASRSARTDPAAPKCAASCNGA